MRILFASCVLLIAAIGARAQAGFTQSIRPEDFTGAGLQKLTPEELARLESLVQRYKSGELAQVRQQAEVKALEAQKAAEEKAAEATAKAAAAEAKAAAATQKAAAAEAKVAEAHASETEAGDKKQPGWFRALITLSRAADRPAKAEPLVSRLVGDFSGWTGATIFVLEDGTRWQQQNRGEKYPYAPVIKSPVVHIKPASISGFWLEIEGVNMSVRVVPIELPGQK